jgi:prolyl-tRNA editing enzyme YbaK/EbsC (Cys-tRNA(Pro) deacylase)
VRAQLRLRSASADLIWPPGHASGVTVLLDGDARLGGSLARALGTVVLRVPAGEGAAALEWAADHAGELAGGSLILGGAADAVLALARQARDDGWPALARLVLVDPRLSCAPPDLAGLAPAVVVGADGGALADVQWPAVSDLPRSARRVRDALLALGLPADIVRLADSTRTAPEAAAAVGCELGAIVKSLVMRGASSHAPALVLVSGANRADEALLTAALGEEIERPDAAYVREVTGYSIGGIPPVGHPAPLRTLLDEDLLGFDVVWAAAGHPHAVFPIAPSVLAEAAGATVTRLAAPPRGSAAGS